MMNESCCAVGKYKVEAFDKDKRAYMPTSGGLGMHVEVRDPDDKTLMSRVSSVCPVMFYHWSHVLVTVTGATLA